jgi:hypothetical protein
MKRVCNRISLCPLKLNLILFWHCSNEQWHDPPNNVTFLFGPLFDTVGDIVCCPTFKFEQSSKISVLFYE